MGLFKKKMSRAQVLHLQSVTKILSDSIQLYNETSNPKVFFGRFHCALDMLLEARKYESYGVFIGPTPTEQYNLLISDMERYVNDLLKRCYCAVIEKAEKLKTPKGKENCFQKFSENLLSDFHLCHTFWTGDGQSPHYTGPLYTQQNLENLHKLIASLTDSDPEAAGLNAADPRPASVPWIPSLPTIQHGYVAPQDPRYESSPFGKMEARHYRNTEQIKMAYSVLNSAGLFSSKKADMLIQMCLEDISLSGALRAGWDYYRLSIQQYESFKRLAMIYEKRKEYNNAIEVCQASIRVGFPNDGTDGQMIGRIARLMKRAGRAKELQEYME